VVALFDGSIQPDIKFTLPLMCTAASTTTKEVTNEIMDLRTRTNKPTGLDRVWLQISYAPNGCYQFVALTLQNIMDTTLLEVLRMGIITRTVASRDSRKALNKLLNALCSRT
jgi:hypothetical protein